MSTNVRPLRKHSKELLPNEDPRGDELPGAVSPRPSPLAGMASGVSNGTLMGRAQEAEKRAQDAVDAAARSGTRFAFRRAQEACRDAVAALQLSGSHSRAGYFSRLHYECEKALDAGDFERRQIRRELRLAFVAAVLLASAIGWVFAFIARAQ